MFEDLYVQNESNASNVPVAQTVALNDRNKHRNKCVRIHTPSINIYVGKLAGQWSTPTIRKYKYAFLSWLLRKPIPIGVMYK